MYQNISRLTNGQIEQLQQLYQHEWWSRGRTLADVEKMLLQSDYVFGICEVESQQLVAFARVLSDRVFRALIFDVIVAAEHRDKGLGLSLIEQIVSHPQLSQVECIQLSCLPEMIPFYQKFDFAQTEQILLLRHRAD